MDLFDTVASCRVRKGSYALMSVGVGVGVGIRCVNNQRHPANAKMKRKSLRFEL